MLFSTAVHFCSIWTDHPFQASYSEVSEELSLLKKARTKLSSKVACISYMTIYYSQPIGEEKDQCLGHSFHRKRIRQSKSSIGLFEAARWCDVLVIIS